MRAAPAAVALPWTEVQGLGEVGDAGALVRGWLDALRAAPGEVLVLEQERAPWGAFLRALARPEVLAAGPEPRCSAAVRLEPRHVQIVPWAPGTWGPCAFGQVLWQDDRTENARFPAPRAFSSDLGTPCLSSLSAPGRWVVQGLFRAGEDRELLAHLRLFAESSSPRSAEELRDRIGLRLGAELGARFVPWLPGSAAHRVAQREWVLHAVERFHSGTCLSPPLEVLARPWRVPPAPTRRVPPGSSASSPTTGTEVPALRLGTVWSSGAVATLPLSSLRRHVGIVGTTGSGKSQLLAHLATEGLARAGVPFVLFDLHGDLGPAVLARLPAGLVSRVEVVDGTRELDHGLVGLNVLGWEVAPGGELGTPGPSPAGGRTTAVLSDAEEDLLAGEFLSALRPAASGGEEFWGPRMERFLETAVRAVLENGGTLRDVADLLYHPLDRVAEVASGVRNPALAEALREWPTLLRRQPDLLASSQNRLLKVLLSPRVAALLACRGEPLVPERVLAEGRSLLFHLPKGSLGEGSALFVANLLLARTFLGLLRARGPLTDGRPSVLFVLDEAQGFSARLLRTIVEEGRKFGAACVFATQSPGRMEEMFGRTPVDSAGTLVALRLPPSDAERMAPALAVEPRGHRDRELRGSSDPAVPELRRSLSTLPPHAAWVRPEGSSTPELLRLPDPAPIAPAVWSWASDRSAARWGSVEGRSAWEQEAGGAREAQAVREVLMRAWRAELTGAAIDLGGEGVDRTRFESSPTRGELEHAFATALRREWVRRAPEAPEGTVEEVTYAGWCRLGYAEDAGAPRESAEHRRLLRQAFRFFASEGYVLEFPRQGDMRRSTPDARLRLRPVRSWARASTPAEDLAELTRLRSSTLWTYTDGRDLYLEAEVTGARSRARLERSLQKARKARAFLLFLVGSKKDEGRIERFLRSSNVGPEVAKVWVIPDGGPVPHSDV